MRKEDIFQNEQTRVAEKPQVPEVANEQLPASREEINQVIDSAQERSRQLLDQKGSEFDTLAKEASNIGIDVAGFESKIAQLKQAGEAAPQALAAQLERGAAEEALGEQTEGDTTVRGKTSESASGDKYQDNKERVREERAYAITNMKKQLEEYQPNKLAMDAFINYYQKRLMDNALNSSTLESMSEEDVKDALNDLNRQRYELNTLIDRERDAVRLCEQQTKAFTSIFLEHDWSGSDIDLNAALSSGKGVKDHQERISNVQNSMRRIDTAIIKLKNKKIAFHTEGYEHNQFE